MREGPSRRLLTASGRPAYSLNGVVCAYTFTFRQKESSSRMSELEQATRRLQAALERLERAAQARSESPDDDNDGRGAVAVLRENLAQTAEDKERLQAVAEQASERLGGAIARLDSLLGD